MPQLNDLSDQMAEQFAENQEKQEKDGIIIKVIGVGGGGNNAVNYMYRQGIKDVSFVVCNTDRQALKNSPIACKVMIGSGLGAGNKPEVARQAAEDDIAKIEALFEDETKMVFITAGMGGGTGTGAAPVVARVAKERGLLTVGIVTIPFIFEGDRKIMKALEGADEMSKYVDALLVINNERLTEIYGDLDFLNAFGKADDTLATAARSISEIITCDGYMNCDFKDVETTLRGGGPAIISCGYGEGENRVTKAIEDALNSPLLRNRDIFGSKHLLFNIYYSLNAEQKFMMSEANELTEFVKNIDPEVDIIWGMGFDESLGNTVKITILAAGFEVTIRDDNNEVNAGGQPLPKHDPAPMYQQRAPLPKPTRQEPDRAKVDRIEQEYGRDKVEKTRQNYIVLTPNQFDDDTLVEKLERSPAYHRDKKIIDEFKRAAAGMPDHGLTSPYTSSPSGFIDFSFD